MLRLRHNFLRRKQSLMGKSAARSVRWRGRKSTLSVILSPAIDAPRKLYWITLSARATRPAGTS